MKTLGLIGVAAVVTGLVVGLYINWSINQLVLQAPVPTSAVPLQWPADGHMDGLQPLNY